MTIKDKKGLYVIVWGFLLSKKIDIRIRAAFLGVGCLEPIKGKGYHRATSFVGSWWFRVFWSAAKKTRFAMCRV